VNLNSSGIWNSIHSTALGLDAPRCVGPLFFQYVSLDSPLPFVYFLHYFSMLNSCHGIDRTLGNPHLQEALDICILQRHLQLPHMLCVLFLVGCRHNPTINVIADSYT